MATTALHPGILAANNAFMEAVKTGDEERFVRLYAHDALLLLPGREALEGPPGARAFFASIKARGVHEIVLTTLEVEVFGDTAWERGSSESKASDGSLLGKGKYIVIWKRSEDGWTLYRDILNASN